MNSKIHKGPPAKVEIADTIISGPMLLRKLEAWCEAEPSILLWETHYNEGAIKTKIDDKGKEVEIPDGRSWTIEMQIIKANGAIKDGLFDRVAIIAGTIKRSLTIVNGRSQEAYLLSIFSRTTKGEKTFTSAAELWKTITNL